MTISTCMDKNKSEIVSYAHHSRLDDAGRRWPGLDNHFEECPICLFLFNQEQERWKEERSSE